MELFRFGGIIKGENQGVNKCSYCFGQKKKMGQVWGTGINCIPGVEGIEEHIKITGKVTMRAGELW